MAVTLFKEMFNEKYDGVTSPVLLPVGAICDGKNVRKVSQAGGWKPRKGCTTHNTTATASAATILSLHQFTHPRNSDYHFIKQCGGSLYDASSKPPASGTTFGTAILASISSTRAGFSDIVEDTFVYADGSGKPYQWGGDTPYCKAFIAHFDIANDDTPDTYIHYTDRVTDGRTDTYVTLRNDAHDVYYVCSPEIAEGIVLDIGATVNAESVTCKVWSWQSSAWDDRSGDAAWSDGTADSGKTHAQDGTIVWTRQSSDSMTVIGGVMGYWYKVSFSGALTNGVTILSCKLNYDMTEMTNKWDGAMEWPLAVRFYDQDVTEYVNLSGKLINEATSMYFNLDAATTSDFLYIKTLEPVAGFYLGVVDSYENTAEANIDNIEYWNGTAWTADAIAAADDETTNTAGTSSLAQSGAIWMQAEGHSPVRRSMDFDSTPGFWYRISWDLAFDNADDDVRLYMITCATYPEDLPTADGVIEFKNRTFTWGDPRYPNRLRFSAYGKPDCFSGSDSGYTDAFGNMEEIRAVVRFYNELIVFKENSVWMLEGYMPSNFGVTRITDTVGLAAIKTAHTVESGFQGTHRDEPLSIVFWMDTDGVYIIDGRKPLKISGPVDQYFNTEYSTAIEASKLDDIQAFVDPLRNEYHLLIPYTATQSAVELVYNYVGEEWYPPWERNVGTASSHYLVCGLSFRGYDTTDNAPRRYYTYGGNNAGKVFRLEYDTTDKSNANADVKITHQIKTRAISAIQKQATTLDFTFRKAWIESKAVTSPTVKTITTNFYKDMATSATVIATPGAISLANTGYNLVVDGINTNQTRCMTFQLEFKADTADLELEIYSFLYTLESLGEFDV